jgi:MFS family permease
MPKITAEVHSDPTAADPTPNSSSHAMTMTSSKREKIGDNGFLGYKVLSTLRKDAWILIFCKAIRLFSYGFLAVMLVIYLQALGFSSDRVGLLLTLTLFGDAALSMFLTTHADHWGRKRTLIIGSVVAITTSFIFATQTNFYILLFAGIAGVISPSGSEIGPFMAIEISAISEVSLSSQRTPLMAWYNLFGSLFSASGALTCGLVMNFLKTTFQLDLVTTCSRVLILYGLIQMGQLCLFFFLSSDIEPVPHATTESISSTNKVANQTGRWFGLHKSKGIVLQLSLLFMLDSFAGSFVLQSIISAWFFDSYHTPSPTLGMIVFYCNIVAGISALFAAQIAQSIGLIMTMVVTHLPSNIFLMLVPIMPSEWTAIMMICARYSISQMDVPTRNAYVQGVVDPDERSAANGVTNVVRSIGASMGPFLSGMLLANPKYRNYPFFIAGGLKVVYDLLLLVNFQRVKSDSDTHHLQENRKSGTAVADEQLDKEQTVELIPRKKVESESV